MSDVFRTRQKLLVGLILASTLAFALGIVLERSVTDKSHTEAATVQATSGTPSETAEGSSSETATQKSSESSEGSSATEPAATHTEAGEQRILGINPESNGPILAAIAVSLALAVAAWRSKARALMLGIVAFGLLFAAFDIRDVIFQSQQSRWTLVALAVLVAALHLSASAVAAINTRANPSSIRH
jgi:hypothetical protein